VTIDPLEEQEIGQVTDGVEDMDHPRMKWRKCQRGHQLLGEEKREVPLNVMLVEDQENIEKRGGKVMGVIEMMNGKKNRSIRLQVGVVTLLDREKMQILLEEAQIVAKGGEVVVRKTVVRRRKRIGRLIEVNFDQREERAEMAKRLRNRHQLGREVLPMTTFLHLGPLHPVGEGRLSLDYCFSPSFFPEVATFLFP